MITLAVGVTFLSPLLFQAAIESCVQDVYFGTTDCSGTPTTNNCPSFDFDSCNDLFTGNCGPMDNPTDMSNGTCCLAFMDPGQNAGQITTCTDAVPLNCSAGRKDFVLESGQTNAVAGATTCCTTTADDWDFDNDDWPVYCDPNITAYNSSHPSSCDPCAFASEAKPFCACILQGESYTWNVPVCAASTDGLVLQDDDNSLENHPSGNLTQSELNQLVTNQFNDCFATNSPTSSPTAMVCNSTMDNDKIIQARDAWFTDQTNATNNYCHISTWNTNAVTDMEMLFYQKLLFNEDISS